MLVAKHAARVEMPAGAQVIHFAEAMHAPYFRALINVHMCAVVGTTIDTISVKYSTYGTTIHRQQQRLSVSDYFQSHGKALREVGV